MLFTFAYTGMAHSGCDYFL